MGICRSRATFSLKVLIFEVEEAWEPWSGLLVYCPDATEKRNFVVTAFGVKRHLILLRIGSFFKSIPDSKQTASNCSVDD